MVCTVAVFNCGYTTPKIQESRGQYSDIFDALLQHNPGTYLLALRCPPVLDCVHQREYVVIGDIREWNASCYDLDMVWYAEALG